VGVQITLHDFLFVPRIHASNHAVCHMKLFVRYEYKIFNNSESTDIWYSIFTLVYRSEDLVFGHPLRVRVTLDNWMKVLCSFIIIESLYSDILPAFHPFNRPKFH
jgi:hypothetical protein